MVQSLDQLLCLLGKDHLDLKIVSDSAGKDVSTEAQRNQISLPRFVSSSLSP